MAENLVDFMHFLGIEETNKMTQCANLGEDFHLIPNLDSLYQQILKVTINKKEQKLPAFLYMNVHREFYLSMCNFLRLHQSKSFCNLRSAIDSVLIAYYLLENPDKKNIYLAKIEGNPDAEKEWNKIFRNIKATINKDINRYPLAKDLIEMHGFCSIYAHADALGIVSRYSENAEKLLLEATYFDYETDSDFKKWLGALLIGFITINDVFWEILFKDLASEKVLKFVDVRSRGYKEKLKEFLIKYPFKMTNGGK